MSDSQRTVSRRKVLIGSTALITGTGAMAAFASEPATGVQISGFNVEQKSVTLAPDDEVTDVLLNVSLNYHWQVSHAIDSVQFTLEIGTGGEFEALVADSIDDPESESSGTLTLSGSLVDSELFRASNFDVQTGRAIAIPIDVRVTMELYRNGEVVGVADASDSGQINLSREELEVSASLGGQGTFDVETQPA